MKRWNISFNISSHKFFQDIICIGILVVLCAGLCFFVLNVNSSTFMMPQYGYEGDTIFGMISLKSMQESFFMEDFRLSSPFVFSVSEFPWDRLNLFLMFFLSKSLSLNIWGALHLYYLATYFLSAIIAYIVLRKFDISASWSLLAAIAYAFVPYHFHRSVWHLALASYYLVPVSFLVFSWLFCGEFKWSYLWGAAFYLVLLALQSTYYFFFAAIILGALFLRTIRIKDKKFAGVILGLLIFSSLAFLTIYKLPAMLYQIENGVNDLFIARQPIEAHIYGLRLTSMMLKSFQFLPQNEAATSYIGLLGIVGLLCLFIPKKREDFLYEMMRFIFIVCFFFCTVDGLGLIFSSMTGGMVRGLNRVIVYLAFIAFLAAAKELDVYTKNRTKLLYLGILTYAWGAVFFDFFDYRAFLNRSAFRNPYASQYESDRKLFQEMENVLPAGAQVYQLPYMPFLEVPPIHNMGDYEHFKAYLHTETLRFSYGANKGRQAHYWNMFIESLPPEDMVRELETCGFGAIYLDTAGYRDGGAALIEKLEDIIGHAPVYSPDRRRLYFTLSPSKEPQDVQYPQYSLSKVIPLSAEKINYKYLALNWNWNVESDGIWSAGRDARFRFDVGEVSSDIVLRLAKTGISLNPEDKIIAQANGENIAVWGQEELAGVILTAPITQANVNRNDGKIEIKFSKKTGSVFRRDRKVRIKIKNIVLDPVDFDSSKDLRFLVSHFQPIDDEGIILFGLNGNDSPYLAAGFSGPEAGFRWTDGKQAMLAFNTNLDSKEDIIAIFDIFPLVSGNLTAQRAEVFVNGTKMEDWSVDKAEEKKLLLPKSLSNDGNFIVTFNLPDAATPRELGINNDMRQLALGFRSVRFGSKLATTKLSATNISRHR